MGGERKFQAPSRFARGRAALRAKLPSPGAVIPLASATNCFKQLLFPHLAARCGCQEGDRNRLRFAVNHFNWRPFFTGSTPLCIMHEHWAGPKSPVKTKPGRGISCYTGRPLTCSTTYARGGRRGGGYAASPANPKVEHGRDSFSGAQRQTHKGITPPKLNARGVDYPQ